MIYEFSPKQDLHGYGKPWASGEGKNKYSDIWEDYTKPANYYVCPISLPEGSTWRIHATKVGETITGYVIGIVKAGTEYADFVSLRTVVDNAGAANPTGYLLTIDETWTDPHLVVYTTSEELFNALFKNYHVQLENSDTATAWEPYTNICPISGYNIWDPTSAEMIPVYSGYVDAEARKLYLHPVYEEYDGEELVGPWMSSMDEYTEEGTPTEGAFVVDFGGEVTEYDITDFQLQTLLDSLGIRRFISSGAMLLNSLMDQAQGRVRSEEELLNRSFPIHVIAIGDQLPAGLTFKPISKDVLPGLPGKFIR